MAKLLETCEYHGDIVNRAHRFYRGTTFQAIVLGLISFTQPGIWDALNNLGAGGQASPYVVNAANAVTFGIMVFFCPISAIIGNRTRLKWLVVFGTIGYVPYCAALYCNSVYGTEWFLIFGAATCGFSAAALWTAEGAIVVGYPEGPRRGQCVATWLALNKVGRLIAGGIQLGLNNATSEQGSVSPSTYLVLVGLTCLGLPLSFTIAPPEKLIRRDGTRPATRSHKTSLRQGWTDFCTVLRTRRIYMMIPIFITAQWGQTYNGNYMAAYFSVRARTLAGLIVTIVGIAVNFLVGFALDSPWVRRSLRARLAWTIIALFYVVSWIYQFIVQAENQRDRADYDWASTGFAKAVCSYFIYRIGYEACGTWMYWVLGTFDSDIDTLALTASILRSGESIGSCISYAVGSARSVTLMTNLVIAALVWFAAIPSTTYSSLKVTDTNDLKTLDPSPSSDDKCSSGEPNGSNKSCQP